MQITIQVRNAELVKKGLANIRAEIPKISERTIEKSAKAVVKRMQIYPDMRPGQKYVRTYTLKNAWRVERGGSGYRIKNATPYGRYVVGDFSGNYQAWMHVGRWQLLRNVTEDEITKLPPMVEEYIRLKARQENLA